VKRIMHVQPTPDVSPDHEMENSDETGDPNCVRRAEPDGRHCVDGTRFMNNAYQSGQYDNFSYGPGDIGVGR
jgi:hypothetical protein